MKSGTMFVLGGLLQGAGKGITNLHEERRQEALLKLKRQYDVEDQATAAAAAEAARVQALADKKEIIKAGTDAALAKEDRQHTNKIEERANDFKYDVSLARIESGLKRNEDAASKRLAAEIDAGQVQSTSTGADGSLVVTYKDGRSETRPDVKIYIKPESDEGGATISGAREGRGAAPKPAKPAAEVLTEQELNRLSTVYANATPQTRPYMFDKDGKKYPFDMVKRMVAGRLSK